MNSAQPFIRGIDPAQDAIIKAVHASTMKFLESNPEPSAVNPATVKLSELCDKYEMKWPEIMYVKGGSRARKAMELVLKGDVIQVGTDRNNNDIWRVAEHYCSKKGLTCDCKDSQTLDDPHYGKLCIHRLAVALKNNWLGDRNESLLAYLMNIADSATGSYFDLLITRVYDYHNEGQVATIAGHWAFGMSGHTRLSPVDEIRFTLPQFQWAMEKAGLKLLDLPSKLPGWSDYYYRVSRSGDGDGLALTEQVVFHKGRTWRMEDRERMRRIQLFDIARHLEEWKNGPLMMGLSSYEAKRVVELFAKIDGHLITVGEAWASLPEMIKISILEKELSVS